MKAIKVAWPDGLAESVVLYQRFILDLLIEGGVDYSGFIHNPLKIVSGNAESASDEKYREEAVLWWWKYIDDNGYVRDLQSEMSIRARFAIELLTAVPKSIEDFYELRERFSWVLQLSGKLGVPDDLLAEIVARHFKVSG
ncbi:hypothetical protein [Pseudomonas sp. UFMG81]|uniref:hypothetical protein n=1 Tax=Pseudomonas sp. UFMG81 TaxID=2745936 RepID=UPI00188F981F|nr:hypothetical protein [Pseudomonas sp. UFMG81]